MNLPVWAIVLLGIYGIINFVAIVVLLDGHGSRSSRVGQTLDCFIYDPIKDGVKLGDALAILILWPSIASILVIFGTLPFICDTIEFICHIRLTKPRPKK